MQSRDGVYEPLSGENDDEFPLERRARSSRGAANNAVAVGLLPARCGEQNCRQERVVLRQVHVRIDAPFAYAVGKHAQGYHTGVVYQRSGSIYFDEHSLLVHPDHLVQPPEQKPAPAPAPT